MGESLTSQLHQTAVNFYELQPDLTLTIPKALGQSTLKGNQSGKSGQVLTEYALRKEQHKEEILWAFVCDVYFY